MSAGAPDERADVVVVGGGTGGTTAATLLARKGLRVVLLERERFPRDHVGESLLPASVPVLESLGVLPSVEAAGFLPKHGATMVWGSDPEPWSWYFRETNRAYPSSFQVTRPEFDRILLDHSRSSGVDVREGHQAVEVAFEGGRANGVRYRTDGGREGRIAADWVVDASGQSALLGHSLGLREWDDFFRNLAIYGYFEGAARLPQPDATNIFIEAYEHGWCWTIPLHSGQASVGAVLDSEAGQARIAADGVHEAFRAQLDAAPRTAQLLEGASLVAGPLVIRDWSYVAREFVGPGYILVGDAACFVDPLFSSGVHLALSSGVLAAAYVSSAVRDPSLQEAAAEAYRELYLGQYRNFHELAKLFYSSNQTAESYFWAARRITDAEAFSPRHAFVRMVAGQSPIGYERAVIARGDAPAGFAESVRSVEQQRAGAPQPARRRGRGRDRRLRTAPRPRRDGAAQGRARGRRVRLGPGAGDGAPPGRDATERRGRAAARGGGRRGPGGCARRAHRARGGCRRGGDARAPDGADGRRRRHPLRRRRDRGADGPLSA